MATGDHKRKLRDLYTGTLYEVRPRKESRVKIIIPFPGPDHEPSKNPVFEISFSRDNLDDLCKYHSLGGHVCNALLWMLNPLHEDRREFSRIRKTRYTEKIIWPARLPNMDNPVAWANDLAPPPVPVWISFDQKQVEPARQWLKKRRALTRLRFHLELAFRDEMLDLVRSLPRRWPLKRVETLRVLRTSLSFARDLVRRSRNNRRLAMRTHNLLKDSRLSAMYLDLFGTNEAARAVALVIHGMHGTKHRPDLLITNPNTVFQRYLYGPPLKRIQGMAETIRDFERRWRWSAQNWVTIRRQWEERLLAEQPGQVTRDFFLG